MISAVFIRYRSHIHVLYTYWSLSLIHEEYFDLYFKFSPAWLIDFIWRFCYNCSIRKTKMLVSAPLNWLENFKILTENICMAVKYNWSSFFTYWSEGQLLDLSMAPTLGGAVVSWLVCSTPERVVRVRALAGDIMLCSWARLFTLTVLPSTQVYKWVRGNLILGVTQPWTSIPSRRE